MHTLTMYMYRRLLELIEERRETSATTGFWVCENTLKHEYSSDENDTVSKLASYVTIRIHSG